MGKKPYPINAAVIEQRRQAHRTHGITSIKHRGVEAMNPEQRSLYAELSEQLETRPGTIAVMKEAVAQSVILARIAQSYSIEQYKAGVAVDGIPLLKNLAMLQNSAVRSLRAYLECLPDDSEVLDLAAAVKKAMDDDPS